MLRMSDLRERDIVEVASGRRLGAVGDMEIDPDTGTIAALIVPGSPRFLGLFGSEEACRIPWTDVVTIGEDVILVRVPSQNGGDG